MTRPVDEKFLTERLDTDEPDWGRRRVVIEGVRPAVDGGRFPIKRTPGETVQVGADIFVDGHDAITAVLRYRHESDPDWQEVALSPLGNDRWSGAFRVDALGRYEYTIHAWVDHFKSWRHDLSKRVQPQDVELALRTGADQMEAASVRATGPDAELLHQTALELRGHAALEQRVKLALDEDVAAAIGRHPDQTLFSALGRALSVVVDSERARFSAWYELFPRSCPGRSEDHGSFADCETRLDEIARMGFDIVYLPPIHPIGRTNRKGRNNSLVAGPKDPGSPWAIGAEEGGHKAVHPDLGTLEDFRDFVARAEQLGLQVALDIAFQCAPDHPYVRDHPQWFRWRPDGTVQYAENPPKKYQDIYPLNFETDDWVALWNELKSVFVFWIEQGVRVFRVDNPHTKPFGFWEWVIGDIKETYPDVLFLSEAFARPRVMYRLAKIGFDQSYTYFTWRNTKQELVDYLAELTRTDVQEYYRPNFWPNTPDILSEYLQFGGRPAFMVRLLLASTLTANYGIYGPAYELSENRAKEPGSEEYLDSEKYQVRAWDIDRPDSLKDLIARINAIRRANPALQSDRNLHFFSVDNEQLICYGKYTEDGEDIIVVVANLDCYHVQTGWVELPLNLLGIDPVHPYQMHDLISGSKYLWNGPRNYIEIDPHRAPGHIFHVRRRVRTEQDFDYFF